MKPDLPPSDQFAMYLASPFHARRMEAGKARMLQRMNNFHPDEVYPAISEALGAIMALGEFYSGAGARTLTSVVAGDPAPNRPRFEEPEPDLETPRSRAPLPPKLTAADKRLLRLMSDGQVRTREQILEGIGSSAQSLTSANAKISELRRKLQGSGIIIDTGPGPTYSILGPSRGLALAMAEAAI